MSICPKSLHVVLDSAAFIERANLATYGGKFYTTQSVIDEIHDAHTKTFINSLPYPLNVQLPTPASVKWVKELSSKTGDYFALSKTDVEVIALTYQLYTEITGSEPVIKDIKRPTFTDKLFFFKKPPEVESKSKTHKPIQSKETIEHNAEHDIKMIPQEPYANTDEGELSESSVGKVHDDASSTNLSLEDNVSEHDWITSENFDQKLQDGLGLGGIRLDDEADAVEDAPPVPVACLTKDFAMQNVLMNAGITLLALSGKIIKQARTHVLWCGSCYAHTTKQNSYFCAICGCPNLRRIPVTLHEDGQIEFHFARKFVKNLRGTKHPIVKPKGGKHADYPIYRADQRLPDRRAPKSKNPNVVPMGATNGLLFAEDEDDFFINSEAAGVGGDVANLVFPAHDVNSKAATQGLRSDGQVPPPPWQQSTGEHGLKPTRYRANRPGRRRTGRKRNKLTK